MDSPDLKVRSQTRPVFQVAELDPIERLPLARLDEFVLQDGAGVPLKQHLKPGAEFVGGVAGHGAMIIQASA